MSWETVIGLEIHVQLATASKIFSGASTAYGAPPNTQACAIDLGLPGVLPVLNAAAVEMAIRLGLALDAQIAPLSVFARKNYFYPDLPKGYQISQYELPIVARGRLPIRLADGSEKMIRVTRAHLEEDAGKSVHDAYPGATGVDLNRAGTPLLEVVSEPDLRSAEEAVAYMRTLHTLVRYLGICDGNMQEGSFRCDANVSVRRAGSAQLGTRAEIKNINSFRFVEKAIAYEVERQIELIEGGGTVVQETRLYDPERDETRSMRSKEDAHDYRYFPDPDLLPIVVGAAELARARAAMPELPWARRARYVADHALPAADAEALTQDRAVADYFEALVAAAGDARAASNWLTGEVFAALNRAGSSIEACTVTPAALGELIMRVRDGTISNSMAKQVFEAMWNGEGSADAIIEARGLKQLSDTGALAAIVDEIVAANPQQVEQYRAGKDKVFGFFVGQVMKKSQGKANPQQVNDLLRRKLSGS
ncbi:MAG TPA: Asp-tRNA(Asn)/Glu-tRNA(Gln) amidotransferase subunit GatB [Gammaproteobacteria bacterium]|nr:Asp-tRNA(Asn)/Glu-tRNA(Gln) amidotransferase subunit GatB [Gammaproteobacteria bacterium]